MNSSRLSLFACQNNNKGFWTFDSCLASDATFPNKLCPWQWWAQLSYHDYLNPGSQSLCRLLPAAAAPAITAALHVLLGCSYYSCWWWSSMPGFWCIGSAHRLCSVVRWISKGSKEDESWQRQTCNLANSTNGCRVQIGLYGDGDGDGGGMQFTLNKRWMKSEKK